MKKAKAVLCGCNPEPTEHDIMIFCGEKNCKFNNGVHIREGGTSLFTKYYCSHQVIVKYDDGTFDVCDRVEAGFF